MMRARRLQNQCQKHVIPLSDVALHSLYLSVHDCRIQPTDFHCQILEAIAMRYHLTRCLALIVLITTSNPLSAQTFVHLFEWSWNDIATECETFLGPQGYDAVQVSPPYEHKTGPQWWVRYQPVTHRLSTSRSGTREEFIHMVQRCNNVGVKIYVDAVINHTAHGSGTGTAGSFYHSSTLNYPLLSSPDFHSPCNIQQSDYHSNAYRVRNCMLVSLPDLDTQSNYVQQMLADYLRDLMEIGVAGFRIDAAKHMEPWDLAGIYRRVNHPNMFLYHEVIDNGGEAIRAQEYTHLGSVTEFKYSGAISDRFLNGGIADLKQLPNWGLLPSDKAVVFTDNHDNQRGHGSGGHIITFKKPELYQLANIFMLAFPYGTPRIMSSYQFNNPDQGPPHHSVHQDHQTINCFNNTWQCEHRWPAIANMVKFREFTDGTPLEHWWQDGRNRIAFSRGDKGFVAINRTNAPLVATIKTAMPAGTYCEIIHGQDCSLRLSVSETGYIQVDIPPYSANAINHQQITSDLPVAVIQTDKTRVRVGEVIVLDGSDSYAPPTHEIAQWHWSNRTSSQTTQLTFYQPGVYEVSLSVVDSEGRQSLPAIQSIVVDGLFAQNFPSLYYRGTSNNWSTTPMFLTNDYTWATPIELDGSSDSGGAQRFKVDVYGNWMRNYGYGQHNQLIVNGPDIYTKGVGLYQLEVNDQALTWKLQPTCDFRWPQALFC